MQEECSEARASTVVDARGLSCPMPLLKLKLALAAKSEDESLTLLVTDEGSLKDIPRYLQMLQQSFTLTRSEGGVITFRLG